MLLSSTLNIYLSFVAQQKQQEMHFDKVNRLSTLRVDSNQMKKEQNKYLKIHQRLTLSCKDLKSFVIICFLMLSSFSVSYSSSANSLSISSSN